MSRCQSQNKIDGGILLSIIIVVLSALCAYGVTEFANNLQLNVLNITDVPQSYRVLFKVSSGMAAIIPMAIFLFLYFTTEIMINDVFEQGVCKFTLFKLIGISYLPMLIYQYFFGFNLIFYCNGDKIKSVDDFLSTKFVFGLQLSDFEFINLVCWGLIFLITILYLLYKDKNVWAILFSVLFPSSIVALVYYIIS